MVFGLALIGCVLLYLHNQRKSREERQQEIIHALLLLGMVLLPIQEGVPSALRWISFLCVLVSIAAMVYTNYHHKRVVREE